MARTKKQNGRRASRLTGPGIVLAVFTCVSADAAPVTPQLVGDLNTADEPVGSAPKPLGLLSPGVELLTASRPTTGRELYRFDVGSGTLTLLRDINPGAGSSSIEELTIVGGIAFFRAFTPSSGWELWRSDGTTAGTRLVSDLWSGAGGSYPSNLMQRNGLLYFGACSAVNDCALWRSDGSAAGTTAVKAGLRFDSNTGQRGAVYNGLLYFGAAEDGGAGYELWVTDGTSSGTVLVKDILPGGSSSYAYSSSPDNLVVAGDILFFRAYGPAGRELWKSDGTAAGTAMVKDLAPGTTSWGDTNSGDPNDLAAVGDRLVFSSSSGNWWERWYWTSDGTESGTIRLRDTTGPVRPCNNYAFDSPRAPATIGTVLYVAGYASQSGCELWKTDGTDDGTVLVNDISPGAASSDPANLTIVAGKVLFTASDGSSGRELWRSDGTDGGTALVKDINPAADPWGSYGPSALSPAGPLLLFSADDGVHGYELWRSDGSSAGTVLAKDIWASTAGSWPRYVVSMGGAVFFAAKGDNGWALWRSDGTPAGTTSLVTSSGVGCFRGVGDLATAGGRLYFLMCDGGSIELWTTDGTASNTLRLATFSYAHSLVEFKGKLYFAGYESDLNFGLWTSDGTVAGTVRVSWKYPYQLTPVGDQLFFAADDADVGFELWKSDGTESGTAVVKDIYPGFMWGTYPNSSYPRQLAALDDERVMFFAWTAEAGVELWRSDGTGAGTQLVKDIYPGEGGSPMQEDSDDLYGEGAPIFTRHGGKLWFFACDPEAGCEPWSTDGTTAGTALLKDVVPGPAGSAMSYFMWGMYPRYSGPRFGTFDSQLFFGAYREGAGFELWKSDGTGAGTQLLKELMPGDGYEASLFDSFTVAGNALYFMGCKSNGYDRFRDCNLWKTDGSSAGTERALATPLSFDADSYYFTGNSRMMVAAASLFVPATDDEHGAELFRVPLIVDPLQLLEGLYAKVAGTPPGVSLANKLLEAKALAAKGQARAACAVVGAFVNEVAAQSGKLLPPGTADQLSTDAQAIRAALGCD